MGKQTFEFPRRLEECSLTFANGSAHISAKCRADLAFVMTTLKRQRHLRLRVVGHSKHVEAPGLAAQRAKAVRAFLATHGVLGRQLRDEGAPPPRIGGISESGSPTVTFKVIQGIFTPKGLCFEPGSTEVSASCEVILEKVLSTLQAHTHIGLLVEGHADSREAAPAALSARRATAVQKWLKAHGAACEIATAAAGSSSPIASNLTAQGKRHNRRVELQIRIPE